jgi:hypothetical protein
MASQELPLLIWAARGFEASGLAHHFERRQGFSRSTIIISSLPEQRRGEMADARDLKFEIEPFYRVRLRVAMRPSMPINKGVTPHGLELTRLARRGLKVAQNLARGRNGLAIPFAVKALWRVALPHSGE